MAILCPSNSPYLEKTTSSPPPPPQPCPVLILLMASPGRGNSCSVRFMAKTRPSWPAFLQKHGETFFPLPRSCLFFSPWRSILWAGGKTGTGVRIILAPSTGLIHVFENLFAVSDKGGRTGLIHASSAPLTFSGLSRITSLPAMGLVPGSQARWVGRGWERWAGVADWQDV